MFTDFWSMGVRHIWAFEPKEHLAHRFDADRLHPVRDADLVVTGTQIRLNVADVFRRLDKA